MQESTETIRLDGIYKKRRTNGSSSAKRRAAHPSRCAIANNGNDAIFDTIAKSCMLAP